MRLDDAVSVFLSEWAAEGPKPPSRATVQIYTTSLHWLVTFAASRQRGLLSDLSAELLRAAIRARMAEPARSASWKGGEESARQVVAAAKRMARWLVAQGVPVHDLSVVRNIKTPERIQTRLGPGEFSRMESVILRRLLTGEQDAEITVPRDLALIALLSDTGLRTSEVCRMTATSVDLGLGWVQIEGKWRKQRALSIWDPDSTDGGTTVRLLAAWLERRAQLVLDHDALWISPAGRRFSGPMLRKALRKVCEAAGLDGNRPPHAFRRGHFTEAYHANPAAVRLLAARMGWSPRSHTMIDVYTRGAEIELTRLMPIPLVSKRWRHQPNGPMPNSAGPPILRSAVGFDGRTDHDTAPPPVERRREPGRSMNSRRSPQR